MNTLPYVYDNLWKEHEIEYLNFNGYTFVEDLSVNNNDYIFIALLFKYNDENVLRGYGDGILCPYIKLFDIENIHKKNRTKIIKSIYDLLFEIFEKYNIKNTKLYQFPYYSFHLQHDIFTLLDIKSIASLNMVIYYDNDIPNDLELNMDGKRGGSVKDIIKKYKSKKIFSEQIINIYFGNIDDSMFEKFVNKHFELAEKKTKSDICWNITKKFILEKKAILLESNNNFVYYFVSENYCHYGINACDKKTDMVTILLYEGIKWIFDNGYNFIYFNEYFNYFDEKSKMEQISKYKKCFCNKIFTNYYIEI